MYVSERGDLGNVGTSTGDAEILETGKAIHLYHWAQELNHTRSDHEQLYSTTDRDFKFGSAVNTMPVLRHSVNLPETDPIILR